MLALEVRRSSERHVEAALEVDFDHCGKVIFKHLVEDSVAQVTGIVDDAVYSVINVQRLRNDGLYKFSVRHAVRIGCDSAAGSANLLNGLLRWSVTRAVAIDVDA